MVIRPLPLSRCHAERSEASGFAFRDFRIGGDTAASIDQVAWRGWCFGRERNHTDSFETQLNYNSPDASEAPAFKDQRMRVKEIVVFVSCSLWLITPSATQDQASARAFMNSAFRLYQNHRGGIYGKHGNDSELTRHFVHSSLQALIDEDIKTVAAAGTDEPYAGDLDLICDCQEYDGIWELHMDVEIKDPKLALVTASFEIDDPRIRAKGQTRIMKYTLVPEHGQWRIYDTLRLAPSPDGVSVRAGLQKDIAFYSNAPKP